MRLGLHFPYPVQGHLQLVKYGSSAEDKRCRSQPGSQLAFAGLVGIFYELFHLFCPVGAQELAYLPVYLPLHSFMAENHPRHRNNDNKNRSQGKNGIVREGGAQRPGIIHRKLLIGILKQCEKICFWFFFSLHKFYPPTISPPLGCSTCP